MELVAGSSGRISSTYSKDWSVTVNGEKYSGTNKIGISNNTTKTLASGTTVISHNADGAKTFSYEFSQEFTIVFSGVSIGTKSGDGTGTLDTIPRASVPTLSATSVDMGSAVTITTNRASSSFTHDLAYSFAGSGYTSIATGVGASYTWTTPDLALRVPNAASGTLTIRCITKNGTTTIGTKTVTMTLKVPASVMPNVSAVAVAEATDGVAAQFGAYVQSRSTLKVNITAAGAKGSTIKSCTTTFDGKTYTGTSWTSSLITKSGTLTLNTKVTDSRGRTFSRKTTITVLAYTRPALTELHVYRVNDLGEADQDGTRIAVRYKYSVTSLGGKNTGALYVQYKKSTDDDTEWADLFSRAGLSGNTTVVLTSPTFSTDYQYDIQARVGDWFTSAGPYNAILQSGAVVLDIAADGKGVAIGKTSEHGGFESGWRSHLWEDGKSVLWSGAHHMTDGQTVELKEPVSEQNYGIVLVFSAYRDGAAANQEWTHHFVPKYFVGAHAGNGTSFFMHSVGFGYIAAKYLYISDQKIVGHASNDGNGATNGIAYNNANYVLRYVIGV